MKKYEIVLGLQLVDGVEYQNEVQFDLDKVEETQSNAIDNVIDFCKKHSNIEFVDNGDFEGNTSLNEGYVESVPFTIKSDLDKESLEKELEKLREQIDYGYEIYIVED